jgi:ribonuclease HIII
MSAPAPPRARPSGEPGGRIGTDESGKGDYFGYLVVAAVFVDRGAEAALHDLGVRDSKRLSDRSADRLAGEIRRLCPHQVVRISPARYNELHLKMGNVNRLLAWAHARAIENLLEQRPCRLVISDQFGDEAYLKSALMAKGKQVRLVQRPRAEADTAVAAASILARAAFLDTLKRLSDQVGVALPKGAVHVVEAAREVAAKGGRELLGTVAKLHFKTTGQVLGG